MTEKTTKTTATGKPSRLMSENAGNGQGHACDRHHGRRGPSQDHAARPRPGRGVDACPVDRRGDQGLVITEANRFTRPGPDLRPLRSGDATAVVYGELPGDLFRRVRDKWLASSTARRSVVTRTELPNNALFRKFAVDVLVVVHVSSYPQLAERRRRLLARPQAVIDLKVICPLSPA